MTEFSKHQKQIIKRYYENRKEIDEQRLGEFVTSLFLSEGKKRKNLWKSAVETMRRLNIPESRIKHVVSTDDPAILAEIVADIQRGAIKR